MAKLRFSYGTMASGKSLQLLTTAYNFTMRGIGNIVLKPNIDTRDPGVIQSRIGNGVSRVCVPICDGENLYEKVVNLLESDSPDLFSWVFVDEAQFLSEEQVEQLAAVVDKLDIEVWCFGLRTDFKTHLFPGAKRLFELADKLYDLKSTCGCGNKTLFNAKINSNGDVITGGKTVDIGGDDKYISLCRKCYFEKTGHKLYTEEDK